MDSPNQELDNWGNLTELLAFMGNGSAENPTMNPWKIVSVTLYMLITVIGLFGNGLVMFVILRYAKMKTVTNTYILNLAVSDFCFLVGLPFLITTAITETWVFGYVMCKVFYILTSINWYTSVFTLTVMSADRYFAICHPVRSMQHRRPGVALAVCVCVWCASFLAMLPIILYATTIANLAGRSSCTIQWPSNQHLAPDVAFIWYSFLLGFAIPVLLIAVFYALVVHRLKRAGPMVKSKEKKKSTRRVTRMVLTIIAVYVICWLPYWVFQVYLLFAENVPMMAYHSFQVITVFSYANSMFNPLLYAFLSENFRNSFCAAINCLNNESVNGTLGPEQSTYHNNRAAGKNRAPVRDNSTMMLTTSPSSNRARSLTATKSCQDEMDFKAITRPSEGSLQSSQGSIEPADSDVHDQEKSDLIQMNTLSSSETVDTRPIIA